MNKTERRLYTAVTIYREARRRRSAKEDAAVENLLLAADAWARETYTDMSEAETSRQAIKIFFNDT